VRERQAQVETDLGLPMVYESLAGEANAHRLTSPREAADCALYMPESYPAELSSGKSRRNKSFRAERSLFLLRKYEFKHSLYSCLQTSIRIGRSFRATRVAFWKSRLVRPLPSSNGWIRMSSA
jgi:hypothetical protein